MAQRIILIPVAPKNSYEACHKIRNKSYVNVSEAVKELTDLIEVEDENDILIYMVSEFADACNEGQFESLSKYFMTCIEIV